MKKIILLSCCLLSFACLFGQSASVVSAEYFFDTDPGVGAASVLPIGSSGAQVSSTATVAVPALPSGFHYLYIRTRDNVGRWSLAESRSVFIYSNPAPPPPGASQIVSAEYFFDTDPGVGAGSVLPVGASGVQVTNTASVNVPALPSGTHMLYIRTKDDLARWSLAEGKPVEILANPCSPPSAPPTVTVTQPTCSTPTGAITVTSPSTGVTYSFDAGATYQAANLISGLTAGTYQVKVKDAVSGCESAATPATVNAASAGTSVLVTNLPLKVCKNGSPIILTGVPAGGAFTIDGISAASFDPARLSAGNHTVAYTAAGPNGCSGSASQIVAVGTAIVFNPATVQNLAACETTAAFSLLTSVSGGATPLAFQWALGGVAVSGGATNPLIFNGLTSSNSGSYTLQTTDADGCSAVSPAINLTVRALSFSVGFTPILCNGQKSTLTITPTRGAVNQFRYSIDGITYKTANIFSNVAPGAYRVTMANSTLNCSGVQNITIGQPAALAATVAKTNITCNNANDGQISVAASGGTTPYLYNFNGIGFLPLAVSPNLAAGAYNVAIKDANGCLLNKTGNVVANPAALVLSTASATNILCAGTASGRIVVSAAGGTGARQYSKNGGTTWQTSSTFSSLTAGTYQISAKDANGCLSNTVTVALTEPAAALSFTTVKTNPACNLSADGSIAITATGGVAPDSFSINNGGKYFNAGAFTGLAAGAYYVRVKDANGCLTATQTVALIQPGVLNFSTTTTAPGCNGGSDGKITVSAPTGGNGAPYTYSADAGATWQTAAIFSGLTAGAYNVKVKDAAGCGSAARIVSVSQPAPITFGFTKQDVACGSTITGVVGISNLHGGASPYKYSKDGGATFQAANSFTGLRVGVYPVQVKDAKNCLSLIQNVPVVSLCPPVAPLVRYQPTQLIPTVVLKIYPNPTDGELVLEVSSLREQAQDFLFFDALGRLARSEKRQLIKGDQRVPFELSDLPQGMYQIVTPGSAPRGADLRFLKL